MYCIRCKRDGVGSFHRCFTVAVRNPVVPRNSPIGRTAMLLLERLKEIKGIPEIPEGVYPERLYHGAHQRCAGAWSWVIHCGFDIGSQLSMSQCVKADKLSVYCNGTSFDLIPE